MLRTDYPRMLRIVFQNATVSNWILWINANTGARELRVQLHIFMFSLCLSVCLSVGRSVCRALLFGKRTHLF